VYGKTDHPPDGVPPDERPGLQRLYPAHSDCARLAGVRSTVIPQDPPLPEIDHSETLRLNGSHGLLTEDIVTLILADIRIALQKKKKPSECES
jgi:hypothetical protein